MNWSRCSKVALAVVVLLVAAVAPVAAVTVEADVPDSAQVGTQQDTTFTFTDLYGDYDQWTLRGQTELRQVTWTVTAYDNTGARVERKSYTGQNFSYVVQGSQGITKVVVRLQGTTPQVEDWHYSPPQTFTYATFVQAQQGGSSSVIKSWDSVRPYTPQSQQARNQIQQAQAAIERAQATGASVTNAEQLLQSAISAYNAGNFDNAIRLANQAENAAESAIQSNRLKQWALIGAGVLLVLLLIAGGVWYYLNNRETHDKLA